MLQSQELVELVFNLQYIPGTPRFQLINKDGFLSIEDFIQNIQDELDFESTLTDTIYWIKFENEISILFALIDQEDFIYDLEVWFDNGGNAKRAMVSNVDWGDKEFTF
mgnify:CR=1 FL=1